MSASFAGPRDLTRDADGRFQVNGLIVGFIGVATMAAPNVVGADAEPVGVLLLVVAIVGYGVSNNVIAPAQRAHGSAAIVSRAQLVGAVVLAPFGLAGLADSDPTGGSIVAVIVLGVVGTGLARALNATLAGRTGAARGSVTTYLVPVVAIALGALSRDDSISGFEIVGTVLASRRQNSITA